MMEMGSYMNNKGHRFVTLQSQDNQSDGQLDGIGLAKLDLKRSGWQRISLLRILCNSCLMISAHDHFGRNSETLSFRLPIILRINLFCEPLLGS
jgi:hypothetical protein